MKVWPDSSVYDVRKVKDLTAVVCQDETRALQSAKDECDINTIVRRFGITGQLPVNVRPPTYADFDELIDFQSAMNAILSAEKSFMAMPADVRERFGNDPARFVDFCSDEKNLDEMRKLGLAVQEVKPPVDTPPA